MRKAAFFLKNGLLNGVDCSNLTQGNPGIGGSEYIILSVVYNLSTGNYGIDITLFVQQSTSLPKDINIVVAKDLKEAIRECDKMKIDTLAFRHDNRWIEDGSYLRLKTVTLSYSLPIHNTYLQGVTIWGSANNLWLLTKYLGSDPETSMGNSVLMQGIDRGLLPQSRNFALGLKINL